MSAPGTVREPTSYELAILNGLQTMPLYQGTVPAHVKARRRAANKAARRARRQNRGCVMPDLNAVPAHTPGGDVNATTPRAERIIDGNTWAVELDLTPIAASLLTDLGRALHRARQTWRLTALSALPPGHPDTAKHLHALLVLAQGALTQPITPQGAEDLSGQLWDAKEEPDWCRTEDCENYATIGDRCDSCQAAAENRSPVRWA